MKNRKITVSLTALVLAAALLLFGCDNSKETTKQLVTEKEAQTQEAGQTEGNSQETAQTADQSAKTGSGAGIADQVQAPEQYEADFKRDKVTVHANARVVVPKAPGFLLYTVTGRPFVQADYDAVSHSILKDAPLWQRNDEVEKALIDAQNEELEEQIAVLEEEKEAKEVNMQIAGKESGSAADKEKTQEELTEAEKMQAKKEAEIEQTGEYLQELQEEIEGLETQQQELRKEMEEADGWIRMEAVVPYVESKGKSAQEVYEANLLDGYATVDGEEYWVSINNNWSNDWRWVLFNVVNTDRSIGNVYMEPEKEEIPEGLSTEEVREKAEEYVKEMGFTDFAPAGEEYFRKYSTDEVTGVMKEGKPGYGIHFTRCIDTIPVTYTHEPGTTLSDTSVGDYCWPYEEMTMVFDEKGLTDFMWNNPYELEKQSDEYVFLMPFSDIKDIFEEMLPEKNDWYQSDQIAEVCYYIDEVRLGYMRVIDQAGAQEGTMIPVWDFFGRQIVIYNDGEEMAGLGAYESQLTINAMDGTIIDRRVGY